MVAASQSQGGWVPTLVTFSPHPQDFFTGVQRPLLTPLEEKARILEGWGVQQLVLLPFDRDLAALSPAAFVQDILLEQLQTRFIRVGEDFRFGCDRRGTAEDLRALAGERGVTVSIAPLQREGHQRISSSLIRQHLDRGEVAAVWECLGRAYQLQGEVIAGQRLGRTLGFPTANLAIAPEKQLPRSGVYAVTVYRPQQPPQGGVMNLGCRPTVQGGSSVEVHLLQWQGDLYGQTLTVALHQYLRPEQKFADLGALRSQIAQDCQVASKILGLAPTMG